MFHRTTLSARVETPDGETIKKHVFQVLGIALW